jgi:hypothetical protein
VAERDMAAGLGARGSQKRHHDGCTRVWERVDQPEQREPRREAWTRSESRVSASRPWARMGEDGRRIMGEGAQSGRGMPQAWPHRSNRLNRDGRLPQLHANRQLGGAVLGLSQALRRLAGPQRRWPQELHELGCLRRAVE